MMRTRCPACGTVFRVTSEQLRLKAGKVRCGHCQTVFNAFDEFLREDESPSRAFAETAATGAIPSAWPEIIDPQPPGDAWGETSMPDRVTASPVVDNLDSPDFPPLAEVQPEAPATVFVAPEEAVDDVPAIPEEIATETPADNETDSVLAADSLLADAQQADAEESSTPPESGESAVLETPEESTLAARQAGLVAARELAETPAYNRWAAGTLADGGSSGLAPPEPRRVLWPFVVAAIFLLLALALQLLLHFRSEVVRWLPMAESYYELAGVAVPLSRNPEMVAIEASDLQADNVRGLFVLQATLHNRATYAQDWPALELTLTDANDSVVARKVMTAAEYLPPTISPERFPANGEVAVRLWIEARNLGAAGYRLYVFYP
ncbi:MAG: DUF3426 domain-containing protein [Dechloromonas sp.]|nr:MAG: DUF3426 domain-containing protein [Dechloromonas sp.]